ncbi:YceI family protein [Paraferrimonas sp. SM1919]|uniref:YceI family protein n=1 Tax=Paraferrimonas sp. SM1919 TaxID=2662263 RepID=UPI0013D86636|nr:YceI family protein [Paraferrimonas sp. SM1919]
MKTSIGLLLLSISNLAWADWALNNDQSKVSFVSIKKGTIAENHYFKSVTGSITESGTVSISIDLSSVETLIPIRNERMLNYLFEVASYPKATITAQLDDKTLANIKKASSVQLTQVAELDLHGVKQNIQLELQVNATNSGVYVNTIAPVIINAANFKLEGGVEKLRELAKLPNIALAVPVHATLNFSK